MLQLHLSDQQFNCLQRCPYIRDFTVCYNTVLYVIHFIKIVQHVLSLLWPNQMETFSALLALCAGNSQVTSEFHSLRPVTPSFDVFFDLPPNKRLSKQCCGWWFEMPSRLFWHHCNINCFILTADFDECMSGPCLHGNCTDLLNGYRCICEIAWTGGHCETGTYVWGENA